MQDKGRIVNNVKPTPVYLSDSFSVCRNETATDPPAYTHTNILMHVLHRVCLQMHAPYMSATHAHTLW